MSHSASANPPTSARGSASGARLQNRWDWRAAANFAGGGTGAGLLLAALLAQGTARYPVFAWAALGCFAAGLACIMLKLGHPLRALNTLRHPQTSWMTREVLAVPFVFGFGATAALVPERAVLAWTAAFSGLAFLYCQARILHAAEGIPAWREPKIVALVVASGLASGAGLLALLGASAAGRPMRAGAALLLATIVARHLAWRRYRRSLASGVVPRATLEVLERIARPFGIGAGIAPAMLVVVSAFVRPEAAVWSIAAAGLAAAAGGWALIFVLITRASYTRGMALPVRLRIPVAR